MAAEAEAAGDSGSDGGYDSFSGDDGADDPLAPLQGLSARLEALRGDPRGFEAEWGAVARATEGAPGAAAQLAPQSLGREGKNRYFNVLPLEASRVRVAGASGDEYINASFVRGAFGEERAYIAAQAPPPAAIADFWAMVWQLDVRVVLMLTRLVERERVKADAYWAGVYGDGDDEWRVSVSQEQERDGGSVVLRALRLERLATGEAREVTHVQFLRWGDHGVSDGAAVRRVLQLVRGLQRGAPGPLLTHCSAGIGRTGTYIAIDVLLRRLARARRLAAEGDAGARGAAERAVDVPGLVADLKRQRFGMVQTHEQYRMLYEVVEEHARAPAGAVEGFEELGSAED